MENSDIGEHEDTDVKNERQKVFNFVVSPALSQESPLVLLQVNWYRLNYLLYNMKHTTKSVNKKVCWSIQILRKILFDQHYVNIDQHYVD